MLPLFRHLGVVAFGRVRPSVKRLGRSLAGGAIAGIFGLTSYVTLLLALGLLLRDLFGPVLAALAIAVVTGLCAGMVIVIIGAMNRRTLRRTEARRRAAKARLPDPMTLQLLAGVPALMKGHSFMAAAAIAALAYGFAKSQGIGREPEA